MPSTPRRRAIRMARPYGGSGPGLWSSLMQNEWTSSASEVLLGLTELPARGRRAALEAALRDAVRAGRLAAGQPLPSSRALAADLGLARGTVVEAYAQLVAEGYLTTR